MFERKCGHFGSHSVRQYVMTPKFVASWIYLYTMNWKHINGNRDYRIQIGGHYMNYNTVYVGMDVHKESFTLCSCKYEDEKASHYQRTQASYKNVLRYLEFLRTIYGDDTRFVCGCLLYTSVSAIDYDWINSEQDNL